MAPPEDDDEKIIGVCDCDCCTVTSVVAATLDTPDAVVIVVVLVFVLVLVLVSKGDGAREVTVAVVLLLNTDSGLVGGAMVLYVLGSDAPASFFFSLCFFATINMKRAATAARTATPPTAMPTMAPTDRDEEPPSVVEVVDASMLLLLSVGGGGGEGTGMGTIISGEYPMELGLGVLTPGGSGGGDAATTTGVGELDVAELSQAITHT